MSAIEVKGVRKKFRLHYDKARGLKDLFLFHRKDRFEDRWVLNGIDFSAEKGEAIGLIGHNGCGKSTLLKLMTRIMYPDEGIIRMTGRVSSLIELGAGFHPDMTGRENIYINAAIFGLTKREIDARVDDIIAFSELESFIDNPVRTYSSGMYMRLAFAVAINVDAEILLVDEILAVGDANFQKKCFDKLVSLKAEGVTIVIVSHDMSSIERICDRVVWVNGGLVVKQGAPRPVIMAYLEFMAQRQEEIDQAIKQNANSRADAARMGDRDVEIVSVHLLDKDGNQVEMIPVGSPVTLEMIYQIKKPVESLGFDVGFYAQDGRVCYQTNNWTDGIALQPAEPGKKKKVCIEISSMCLVSGSYWVDVSAINLEGFPYDYRERVLTFQTTSPIRDGGICRLPHKWVEDEGADMQE